MPLITASKARETPWEYLICIPDDSTTGWMWYNLPKDVYKSKPRPICKCGRKYVKQCFFCNFTSKTTKKEPQRVKNVLPTPPKILGESYLMRQHKPTDNARMSSNEIELLWKKHLNKKKD